MLIDYVKISVMRSSYASGILNRSITCKSQYFISANVFNAVAHKSQDPCFHVFVMEVGVLTFAAHCTLPKGAISNQPKLTVGQFSSAIIRLSEKKNHSKTE